MKTQTKIWAIVPAAGSGSRFSKTELKQYQYIQNKTVLEHTVSRLNSLDLAGLVLAINEQDEIAPMLSFTAPEKLHFCHGGEERVNSVLNALTYLSNIAHEDDWVLVHDAARPCVTAKCLEKLLLSAIESNQSSILAIPVRDTLKLVETENQINKTVSRNCLWQAQTPQIAKLKTLKNAIEYSILNEVAITDEASALEFINEPVHVVQGRSDNIKITYADDLELAKLILQSQINN
ncbi:2-C-methyl-D-erythritol 4-phosphate cytidylyltransferase [Acinetobacter sp. Z1]|uniref:2-C-methyl-D-erythritol 4-phosphate cytidylyltransferase n=1 Tax=Acinetobacter sp. Z1 TaxID=2953738 RepID=UPI0020C99433|nr:2-C-methyl-D-erythritol 4-phosphate cytidylyltransferase [Acinetobacter sp. Z1]UTO21005.1 2-C-methyl-D-erythritol 4-phosphate cytidylyltransferase [Acinetobacter sp. Z1]